MAIATLISGFIFAFVTGWLMSLVVFATLPLFGIAGVLFVYALEGKDKKEKEAYAKAGGRAEQAIESIKTIKILNGEEYESKQYRDSLEESASSLTKFGFLSGAGIGSLFFVMLAAYALGFWFGSKCIIGADNCPKQFHPDDGYTAGAVMTIFFSLLMAGFNMNQLGPALKSMTLGKQAAARIFPILDR